MRHKKLWWLVNARNSTEHAGELWVIGIFVFLIPIPLNFFKHKKWVLQYVDKPTMEFVGFYINLFSIFKAQNNGMGGQIATVQITDWEGPWTQSEMCLHRWIELNFTAMSLQCSVFVVNNINWASLLLQYFKIYLNHWLVQFKIFTGIQGKGKACCVTIRQSQ